MQFKPLLTRILKLMLLAFLGIVITWFWAGWVPFDGPELGIAEKIGCGDPSGFPFAFIGTWKYLEGVLHPLCAIGINYIAFALNILLWTGFLYLLWYLVEKLFSKLKSSNNVEDA